MHHRYRLAVAVALALVALPLAGCQRQQPTPTPTPSPSPSGDVLARIAALPPGQRDGVLFRAIRDAGHECQEIGEVKPQPTGSGTLAWLATCDAREQWLISMDRTGTATVIGARDAAAAARR